MKIQSIIAISASLLLANIAVADKADDVLEKTLKQAVNQRHVDIDVDDGVVTIEGEVRSDLDRQAIDRIVRNTPGVAAVKNNLEVKYATAITPTPAVSHEPPLRPAVPVYTTQPAQVVTPAPVVKIPAPVAVPDYPMLKVQAWAEQDVTMANAIGQRLRSETFPATGFNDVTITVRNGTATLQGIVSQQAHDALIASIQKGGGLSTIYDQMQIK